jgi:hypothetical protein
MTTPQVARHRRLLQHRWWTLPDLPSAPPRGSTIDAFFILGGGRCQTRRQHTLGGPPSMTSSTSVVNAAELANSAAKGTRHQRLLQPRWWPLSNPPASPPGGPPSMSFSTSVVDAAGPAGSASQGPAIDAFFNLGDGHYWTSLQPPQVGHHRCLQHRWWTMSDPRGSAPRGPANDVFFNLNGRHCQTRQQCPRGRAIDVFFNLDGGRYRTRRQRPQGPANDVFFNLDVLQQVVAVTSIYCQHLPRGHFGKLSLLGVLQARHFARNFFWILAMLRTRRRQP